MTAALVAGGVTVLVAGGLAVILGRRRTRSDGPGPDEVSCPACGGLGLGPGRDGLCTFCEGHGVVPRAGTAGRVPVP